MWTDANAPKNAISYTHSNGCSATGTHAAEFTDARNLLNHMKWRISNRLMEIPNCCAQFSGELHQIPAMLLYTSFRIWHVLLDECKVTWTKNSVSHAHVVEIEFLSDWNPSQNLNCLSTTARNLLQAWVTMKLINLRKLRYRTKVGCSCIGGVHFRSGAHNSYRDYI